MYIAQNSCSMLVNEKKENILSVCEIGLTKCIFCRVLLLLNLKLNGVYCLLDKLFVNTKHFLSLSLCILANYERVINYGFGCYYSSRINR